MSKYKFRRKDNTSGVEEKHGRIMNASASPEESTAVFAKPEKSTFDIEEDIEHNDDIFLPFETQSEVKKHSKKKSKKEEPAKERSLGASAFSFGRFLKNSDKSYIEEDDDIVAKVEDILREKDMTVDEIKENLSSGKQVNLSEVFSDKKAEPVEEANEDFSEEDTYEGLEETAIEEDADFYVEGSDDVDVPLPPKPKKVKKEMPEYTIPEDKEEFTELYRKKGQFALLSLIATFISTLVLIYIETKSLPHPEWLMPGKYGILFLMFDLQFVFISAICILNSLIDGAKQLFLWKPNKNSVTFVTFLVAVIEIFIHLIFNKYSKDVSLYSSVFSVCATVTALVSYIDARREHISFRVAASSRTKNIVTSLDEHSTEYEKFSEYLPEDASLYKIGKTSFVSDFFKTTTQPSPYNEVYKVLLPLVFLASIIFAILSATLVKETTFCDAINNFALACMMAFPVSSLFTVSLPFFITTLRLAKIQSAIIGEASVEQYANTSLISFADTDVFNPKGIKITSIKTYGKSRIDNTYLIAAKAFNLMGGPLEEVFNRSVIATLNDGCSDSVISVSENGFCASIDSHKVFIGRTEYIEANGFSHIDDAVDSAFVTSNGRIMYVAIDDEISAKFYVKYALGRNFKALLDSFRNLGICMAINTRDPNLDTKFVTQILKDDSYPIIVVNNCDVPSNEENSPFEREQSGIVSASSVTNILRTFLSADRLSEIISINTLAKYISLIFAFTLVIVAFLADGSQEKITPMFIILYQFIWSLPIIGTSIFG